MLLALLAVFNTAAFSTLGGFQLAPHLGPVSAVIPAVSGTLSPTMSPGSALSMQQSLTTNLEVP